MNRKELNLRRGIKGNDDTECFDVIGLPENIYGQNNDCCDYEGVMKMINETHPDSITIDPEDINGITLVRLLHDTLENYLPSTRKVERGGEFVEKYTSYDLKLHLKHGLVGED